MNSIYLDYNATTPVSDKVIDRIQLTMKHYWHNVSSSYAKCSLEELQMAELTVKQFLWPHCIPDESMIPTGVIFTSGATEANVTIINALAHMSIAENKKSLIVTSEIEHDSILTTVKKYKQLGMIDVYLIPVKQNGVIDVELMMNDPPPFHQYSLVLGCVMLANNETGIIQPVSEFNDKLKLLITKSDYMENIFRILISMHVNDFKVNIISTL
ncbi:hypothetical protein GJ496_000355 [Pomphorhynchus laevis]|nr:hypothetical protein GJ496_000355 [Pomphorhynchus laevis]